MGCLVKVKEPSVPYNLSKAGIVEVDLYFSQEY